MARYLSDQNKVVLLHESGTYANTSGNGYWLGQVTDHAIDDSEGIITERYLGAASRSVSSFDDGPRDVTGTLSYHPQDMRLVFWALGSVVDVSGTQSQHMAFQINTDVQQSAYTTAAGSLNPPFSFTLEDSKQSTGTGKNFIRTVRGIVPNTTTLTLTQGEKATVEVNYIGQTLAFSSGNTTSLTEVTRRPYLWSDTTLVLGGSTITTAKEISLEINQNVEGPHYVNGSRVISVPFVQNRDYTLSVTLDLDSEQGNLLYDDLYKTTGSFNGTLTLNASSTAGSQYALFIMSGCRIVNTPTIPSPAEGINEVTFEIMPQNITGSAIDSLAHNALYNPW